ncbi:hypothetical protein OESDEN_14592, partial [Oesophagostomum dentatum]
LIGHFRIIEFVKTNVSTSASILDLGCGNGSVLRRLRKHGFSRLTGVDYCPAAIELARRISEEENRDVEIKFEVSLLGAFAKCLLSWDAPFLM